MPPKKVKRAADDNAPDSPVVKKPRAARTKASNIAGTILSSTPNSQLESSIPTASMETMKIPLPIGSCPVDFRIPPHLVNYMHHLDILKVNTVSLIHSFIHSCELRLNHQQEAAIHEWKGRMRVLIHVFFIVYRHMPLDARRSIVAACIPAQLADQASTLTTYFEKSYDKVLIHYREMIRRYAYFWINETEAGKAWVSHIRTQEENMVAGTSNIDQPLTPKDLLEWHGYKGMQFTKMHAIHFYARSLMFCETDNASEGDAYVGWLSGDNNQWWLCNLTNVALELILWYIQHVGPVNEELKTSALTAKMGSTNFTPAMLVNAEEDWPEFNPKLDPAKEFDSNATIPMPTGAANMLDNIHQYKTFAVMSNKPIIVEQRELELSPPSPSSSENDTPMPSSYTETAGEGTVENPYTHLVVPGPAPRQFYPFPSSMDNDDSMFTDIPNLVKNAREADKDYYTAACDTRTKALADRGVYMTHIPINVNPIPPAGPPENTARFANLFASLNPFGQINLMCTAAIHHTAKLSAEILRLQCEEQHMSEKLAEALVLSQQLQAERDKYERLKVSVADITSKLEKTEQYNTSMAKDVDRLKAGKQSFDFGAYSIKTPTVLNQFQGSSGRFGFGNTRRSLGNRTSSVIDAAPIPELPHPNLEAHANNDITMDNASQLVNYETDKPADVSVSGSTNAD